MPPSQADVAVTLAGMPVKPKFGLFLFYTKLIVHYLNIKKRSTYKLCQTKPMYLTNISRLVFNTISKSKFQFIYVYI